MTRIPSQAQQEILANAARLIVEDGFEYGPAKQQALKLLGLPIRTPLPDNDKLEDAVQEYIDLFYSDTQPQELAKLRQIALDWMDVMQEFSPFLSGSVWHGTATRHSDIHLELFCSDPKAAGIHLINKNIPYTTATTIGLNRQEIPIFITTHTVREWQQQVMIQMSIYDCNDIRGALKVDKKGRSPRGNYQSVYQRLPTPLP